MREKKQRKQYAAQWTAEGLPRDPNAWTYDDWASLWRAYQQIVREVAGRHAKERRAT